MTSGQGGHDPQQGWQAPPPGWQPPPPQGWQPPQQNWQAPPPPGQYGYGPAPSAPGHAPQEAPPRPDTVRFGVGAFIANLVLGLIGAVVTFASFDAIIDAELARSGVSVSEDAVQAVLVASAVIGLLFVALEALFIWFAWNGRNWARIVLFVLGGLSVVGGLSALAQPSTGFLTGLSLFQMVLAIAGVVLLARRPSTEWYKAMGWRRAAGVR
ncbi:hypothetical protein GCU56_18150 [Geodermatophilus sabuli]|uniref:Uncharacterized protein n=1 Tax=Geodermatophilus sabuli TaxID=1564158 RepID=A0A7K3W4G6_9ACTN|nr:hypothetical protein [Geodermatophilus sabuli]NEK59781.1 hypothetical protein [Geodermatophilus sabuli]